MARSHESPHVAVDVDYWKTFVHNGLATPAGDRGSIGIFGKTGQHELFALVRVPRHPVHGLPPLLACPRRLLTCAGVRA